MTFPPQLPTLRESKLFAESLASGVLYVPGEYCFQGSEHDELARRTMRLCFGAVSEEQIREGVARLASAARRSAGVVHNR